MPRRRQLLAAAGVAIAGAGCAGVGGESGPATGAATGSADPALQELRIENNDGATHQIQVAVQADGEIVHMGTYDLEGDGDSTSIREEFAEAGSDARIHARLGDGEIRTAAVTCSQVLVRIDDEGELAVWNGATCE